MHVPSLIEHKREGGTLGAEEIRGIIAGFTRGEVPDYQMSALAMAIYFRGMDAAETAALTEAMLGRVLGRPNAMSTALATAYPVQSTSSVWVASPPETTASCSTTTTATITTPRRRHRPLTNGPVVTNAATS